MNNVSVPAELVEACWKLADEWDEAAKNAAERAASVAFDRRQHYADVSENYEYFASRLRSVLAARALVDAVERPTAVNVLTGERVEIWRTTPGPSISDEAEELAEHEQNLRELWRELAEKRIEYGVDWPRIVLTLFGDIDRLAARLDRATKENNHE